jgi:hypothetical protein
VIPSIEVTAGPEVTQRACEALADRGCVRLIGAFATAQLDDPGFYANEWVYAIAARMLGAGFVLGQLEIVSPPEHEGREAPTLFGDRRHDAVIPAIGIAMRIPVESDARLRVWPGSHRVASDDAARAMSSEAADLLKGSCLLMDTRLMHASTDARPIVHGAYHRKWYRGFETQTQGGISRRAMTSAPEAYRHLFEWRFDKFAAWRRRTFAQRVVSFLPVSVIDRARKVLK